MQHTSSQGILEDLLEAQELQDGEVHRGVEAKATLVGTQGGVELNAIALVDLDLALIIFPNDTELDDALRNGDHGKRLAVLGVLLEKSGVVEGGGELFVGLLELGLVRIMRQDEGVGGVVELRLHYGGMELKGVLRREGEAETEGEKRRKKGKKRSEPGRALRTREEPDSDEIAIRPSGRAWAAYRGRPKIGGGTGRLLSDTLRSHFAKATAKGLSAVSSGAFLPSGKSSCSLLILSFSPFSDTLYLIC